LSILRAAYTMSFTITILSRWKFNARPNCRLRAHRV